MLNAKPISSVQSPAYFSSKLNIFSFSLNTLVVNYTSDYMTNVGRQIGLSHCTYLWLIVGIMIITLFLHWHYNCIEFMSAWRRVLIFMCFIILTISVMHHTLQIFQPNLTSSDLFLLPSLKAAAVATLGISITPLLVWTF